MDYKYTNVPGDWKVEKRKYIVMNIKSYIFLINIYTYEVKQIANMETVILSIIPFTTHNNRKMIVNTYGGKQVVIDEKSFEIVDTLANPVTSVMLQIDKPNSILLMSSNASLFISDLNKHVTIIKNHPFDGNSRSLFQIKDRRFVNVRHGDPYLYVINTDRLLISHSNMQTVLMNDHVTGWLDRQIRNIILENTYRYIYPLGTIEIRDNVIAVINSGTDTISIYDFNIPHSEIITDRQIIVPSEFICTLKLRFTGSLSHLLRLNSEKFVASSQMGEIALISLTNNGYEHKIIDNIMYTVISMVRIDDQSFVVSHEAGIVQFDINNNTDRRISLLRHVKLHYLMDDREGNKLIQSTIHSYLMHYIPDVLVDELYRYI